MSGFRILSRQRQVDAALVTQFRDLPVANISDSMHRLAAAGPRLRPMHQGGALAGVALTVKTRPGDNLMIHKALDLAQPGDVIVVDGGGDLIVGDADGLVCVPFDEVQVVLAATLAKGHAEKKTLLDIASGTHDTAWVDAALRRAGCEVNA